MKLFRVADNNFIGPYQNTNRCVGLDTSYNKHRPTPYMDFGRTGRSFIHEGFFAFPSKKAITDWFTPYEIAQLSSYGFSPYVFEIDRIWVYFGSSNRQVLVTMSIDRYLRDNAPVKLTWGEILNDY